MLLKKIAFALTLGTALNAAAMDGDVALDLSVLDDLPGSYAVAKQPLFPVVSKTKTVQKHSVKKAKKKVAPRKSAVKAEVVKQEEPKLEKIEEVKITETTVVSADKELNAQKQEEALVANTNENAESNETVVVVDVEPEAVPVPAEVSADSQVENNPVSEEVNTTSEAEVAVQETVTQDAANESQKTEESAPVAEDVAEEAPKNIGENTQNYSLTFADEQDELDTDLMQKLDDIAGRFKNEQGNKIMILSYNANDGENEFRKKRISLNRAIEIRSYLIKQGFKNFNIKVINIKPDSDKVNMVELEEI